LPSDVIARYRAGELTLIGVAALAGLSTTTARRNLRAAGLDTSHQARLSVRPRPKVTLSFPAWVLARYASGEWDHNEVATLYGVSAMVALRELRAAGADTSRSTRKLLSSSRRAGVADLDALVAGLYRRGLTLTRVAERAGMTPEGVRQNLLRQGIPLQPRGPRGPFGNGTEAPAKLRQLGQRLRVLRNRLHLSLAQLARHSGVSAPAISKVERGGGRPSWETCSRLAKALGVDLEVLGIGRRRRPRKKAGA
jgi:transcriptional regulator with XRE-family HTH domain